MDLGNPNIAEGDIRTCFPLRRQELFRHVTVLAAERQVALYTVVDNLPAPEPIFGFFKQALTDGRHFRIPETVQATCAECKGARVPESKTGAKASCQPCAGTGPIRSSHFIFVKSGTWLK